MMRALYSGVSGLRVHQTKMDVIGNNISNVNTVGFKASTVNFSDIFYQTTQSASGPNAETGATGQNAKQIGLGANLASIKTQITTKGGAQRTDNPLDVMISDDSFFIVSSGGSNYFTKSGAFEIDAAGTLTTSDGAAVMGWQVDPDDPTRIVANQVSALKIRTADKLYTEPEATEKIFFSGNIDQNDKALPDGKISQMQFYDSLGNIYTAKLKFTQIGVTGAGTYRVSVTDILGEDNKSIFLEYNEKTKEYTTTGSPNKVVTFGGGKYSPSDALLINQETGTLTLKETETPATLIFTPGTGEFLSVGADPADTVNKNSLDFTVNSETAGLFKPIDVDFSTMTQFSASGVSTITPTKGGLDHTKAGKKVGKMTGQKVDTSGKVFGTYDNGDQKLLGQIAVASFANPAGLEAVGSNRFAATQNSGDFDGVGKDISATGGKLSTGVLEMSNVDLSQQFTDMITTQRGFQANSRIITTSDTLLEELINLKR